MIRPVRLRTYVRLRMPWRPSYGRAEASAAIEGAASWKQVLERLGCRYHGKSIETVRKWAAAWEIDVDHLSDMRGSPRPVRRPYSESEAREAIRASRSWSEALRRLGYCPTGGNPRLLQQRAAAWGIPTDHFDPYATSRGPRKSRMPLDEILVEDSTYSRGHLKRRLYEAQLKQPRCELCGQDEMWHGRKISLILDHVNGVRNDNRLDNLRIVCPNCAAGLDTHCGRRNRVDLEPRQCVRCGSEFQPREPRQRYCSRYCGSRWDRSGVKRPGARKVERPPEAQLIREVEEHGYLGVGRRYGVSDNAIRKWVRDYARERAKAEGRDPDVVEIPRRTWPNMRRTA